MVSHRAAFTLLEICLTLVIGMVLIMLAIPSVSGLLAEQRLHETWDRLEQMVNSARLQSMNTQKPYRLVWDKHRITLISDKVELESLTMVDEEGYEIIRTAALINSPPEEWTFWPNGTCEPVIIRYHGRSGRWQVRFDALSPRGTFLQSETL